MSEETTVWVLLITTGERERAFVEAEPSRDSLPTPRAAELLQKENVVTDALVRGLVHHFNDAH